MNTETFLAIIVGLNINCNMISKIKNYHNWGGRFLNDEFNIRTKNLTKIEIAKTPPRSEVINFLLTSLGKDEAHYLEIGVRNPKINFDLIKAKNKYSVDPGIEFKENPVDFKMTSDEFFKKLRAGEILNNKMKFDVIFIDGLHVAEQVDKDIQNSLEFIQDNGFIVLHDCNPPTEWHAREEHEYRISPAMDNWNGTTWKAFYKARKNTSLYSCCIDSDWGIGVISKTHKIGEATNIENDFYEYKVLDAKRTETLNLIEFETFKKKFG